MIDKRVNFLVTTIVRTVVEGAPVHLLSGNLRDDLAKVLPAGKSGPRPDPDQVRRVLVVDDESLIADSVAAILNRNG